MIAATSQNELLTAAAKVLGTDEVARLLLVGISDLHKLHGKAYNAFRDEEAQAYADIIAARVMMGR